MPNKKVVNYVKKKNKSLPEYHFGHIQVLIKDPIENDIDLASVFAKVNYLVPDHFIRLIDIVYIGEFDIFAERRVNAYFLDDALYISNDQEDEEDLIDDVIHEIGHAVEKRYDDFIYGDGKIEDEFILKRSRLKRILQHQGYGTEKHNFLDTEYNKDLDFFLLDEVGYDALSVLSVELFLNPYSATSLNEYFGNGFLEFYLGNRVSLKELCPYIYKKLILLHEEVQKW